MNQFLEACGATGPLLLNVEAPGVSIDARAYDLPFVLIGKDPRCDLRLDHPEVSPRHAYVQLVEGRLLCADLGSRGGVHQGGKRRRIGWLDRDRAVRIGPYRIRLLSGDNPVPLDPADIDDPLAPLSSASRGHGRLSFELSHRSVRLSRCEFNGGLALAGSAADCEVRLIDPSVASYHCALVPTPNGVWVVDLMGQGGIRVNGHEVSYARLIEGDSLQLGHSMIRLVEPAVAQIRPATVVESPGLSPLSLRLDEPSPSSPESIAKSEPQHLVPGKSPWDDSPPGGFGFEEREHRLEEIFYSNGFGHSLEGAPHYDDGFVFGHSTPQGVKARTSPTTSHRMSSGELALPVAQAVEIVERVLAPMLGQVGLMQQQMVEELHQARSSMFEMFSTLQQEQSAALDHELDQLRLISQDLNIFRADLERQSRTLAELSAKVATTSPEPATVPKPTVADISMNTAVTLAAPRPIYIPPAANPVQASISIPLSDLTAKVVPSWGIDDDLPDLPTIASKRINASAPGPIHIPGNHENVNGTNGIHKISSVISAAPTRRERTGPVVIPSFPVPKVASKVIDGDGLIPLQSGPTVRIHDENIHNQLCERIVKIREEHKSRWKRLLSILPGAGMGRSAP